MPEIEAEEINKVSNVPRFSIVKFIRFGVNTAEFVIKVLPETSEEDAFFKLISCAGVAGPISILTSSRPILPDTLFVYLNRINLVVVCGTSVNIK